MLIIGFKKDISSDYEKQRQSMLDHFQEKLLSKNPQEILMAGKGLSPSIYDSVSETTNLRLLPSLRNTILLSVSIIIGIILCLQAFWISSTEKIQGDLKSLQQKIGQQNK